MTEQAQAPAQVTPQAGVASPASEPQKVVTSEPAKTAVASEVPKGEDASPTPNATNDEGNIAKIETPDAPEKVVPEKYDLKVPKGSDLTAAQVDKIAALAKERGLSNDEAQGLLEEKSNTISEFVGAQKEQIKQQVEVWQSQVKNDKEIGGDGFKQNVEMAKRVVQKYATDDFKKALNETGLGNHPELVRVFARIGKAMSEDQLVLAGTKSTPAKKAIEDVFYGGTNTN